MPSLQALHAFIFLFLSGKFHVHGFIHTSRSLQKSSSFQQQGSNYANLKHARRRQLSQIINVLVPTSKKTNPLWESQDDSSKSTASTDPSQIFDSVVLSRSACKKFQRNDGNYTDVARAKSSLSNTTVVEQALACLKLAQCAPSSFNTQPYKLVLVHSQKHKQKLSRYALGPNHNRVLDSDCTVIFLADRQVMRTFPRFLRFLRSQSNARQQQRKTKPLNKSELTLLFYITLFSSGYPLPRILSAPLSFLVRLGMSIVETLIRWYYVLPSFSTAETWATKQMSMVAMTYMLSCSSKGLATCPMEGINAAGIRKALKIPRRYAIPMIVATGKSYPSTPEQHQQTQQQALAEKRDKRYPSDEMIFCNEFGGAAGVNEDGLSSRDLVISPA